MTNYTYEEKQIAIKVLEELLDEMGIDTRHDSYSLHPYTLMIHTKIKELKTVTFGDIKNQVDTKFRVENNPDTLLITKHVYAKEFFVLNTCDCLLCPVEEFNDQDNLIVEVINEN